MSYESVPSMFPDRPIHPLPKRRLRERLSPQVADSIQYPPALSTTSAIFQYPHDPQPDEFDMSHASNRLRSATNYPPPMAPRDAEQDSEEDDAPDFGIVSKAVRSGVGAAAATQSPDSTSIPPVAGPGSGEGSGSFEGHGSDMFEKTYNNKKRKIPNMADTALLHSRHSVNVSVPVTLVSATTKFAEDELIESPNSTANSYSSFANGSQNIAGPGRGRYGRTRSRGPLSALSDSTNHWLGRSGKFRPNQSTESTPESLGIISSAIANAGKLAREEGQENVSLLQQHQAKNKPASTQFTFTCDATPAGPVAWPGSDRSANMSTSLPAASLATSHSSQTSAPSSSKLVNLQVTDAVSPVHSAMQSGANNPPPPSSEEKARTEARQIRRELRVQARERMLATQEQKRRNTLKLDHATKSEDKWMCYFCEYESIFGEPPFVLIRLYEEKERTQRKAEEERRARLARKLSNLRKGKNKKGQGKNVNPAAPDPGDVPPPGQGPYDPDRGGEEYYEDDYFEDEDELDEGEDGGSDDDPLAASYRRHSANVRVDPGERLPASASLAVDHGTQGDGGTSYMGNA